MSAPELNLFSLASIGIALLASLTGSLHCVGMCGPLRLFAGSSAWAGAKYQAGRLAAYILLGLAAGSIGAFLPTWAVLLFLVIGIALSLGNFRFPAPVERLRARAIMAATAKPWLIGFISGALPCGLLHGWLAAAAATGNAIQGAALLFMLWLGTVPALEASTHFLRRPV
ncbi:MAG: urease accessory protein UreH domain-containing protein, partial [Bdellovibrionota bacterium]